MAKTYVGYVKRDVESQTDWSAITKNMTDMLKVEGTRREEKKANIDKASSEFGKVLSDAEGSGHQGLNEFWLEGAHGIQEARRMQDKLLKSGLLNYKDYISQRQNLTDGSDELIGIVKGFNTKFEAIKNDPNASAFDYSNMANVQGFTNFTENRSWINPTDGKISLGKRVLNEDTGQYELSKNQADFHQIGTLKNRMSQRSPIYDWSTNLQEGVDTLGRYVKSQAFGGAKSIEDITKSSGYKNIKSDWITSMMTNGLDNASMLIDWGGVSDAGKYEYVYTKEETLGEDGKRDESKIYLAPSSLQQGSGAVEAELTEGQTKIVKDKLEENFDGRQDYIETPAQRFAPPRSSPKERESSKRAEVGFGIAYDITKGGEAASIAKTKIESNNKNILDIYETDDVYVIQYKDGSNDTRIDKIFDADNNELKEDSAVSLMAAVSPGYDVTQSETAKIDYFKKNEIYKGKKEGNFGSRAALSVQASDNYQTRTQLAAGSVTTIADEIQDLGTPEYDEAPKVRKIVKNIQPLPGTESLLRRIKVTPNDTGITDANPDGLIFDIPKELMGPINSQIENETFGGRIKNGKVYIDYNDKADKQGLTELIDSIIEGMFERYNSQDQKKEVKDKTPGLKNLPGVK